ncbi:MAG: hypothetical protein V2I76_02075, partial [Roseobacter sp.]|nr:hypothetical protein [Roseobacter sp.]
MSKLGSPENVLDRPALNVVQIVALNLVAFVGLALVLRGQGMSWGWALGTSWLGAAVITFAAACVMVALLSRR